MKKKKITLLDTGMRNTTIAVVISPTFMDIKRSKRKQYIEQWKKDNPEKLAEYHRRYRNNHREEYNTRIREFLRKKRKAAKKKNDRKTVKSRGKNVQK